MGLANLISKVNKVSIASLILPIRVLVEPHITIVPQSLACLDYGCVGSEGEFFQTKIVVYVPAEPLGAHTAVEF